MLQVGTDAFVYRVAQDQTASSGPGRARRAPARRGRGRLRARSGRHDRDRGRGQAARRRARRRAPRQPRQPAAEHGPVRPLDPPPGLRDRDEPAADRARRDRLHAPDAARAAGDRPADRVGLRSSTRAPRPRWSRRRITQVLEDALSGIEGVETIESQSSNGEGSISIEFSLDRDIEAAANDVRDAVSRVVDRLPEEADPPRDREGGVGFRRDPVAQHELDADGHPRADRLRRPLRGGPALVASTACRACASAAASATRCACGSTAPRSPRAGSRSRTSRPRSARERRAARPAASSPPTATSRCASSAATASRRTSRA